MNRSPIRLARNLIVLSLALIGLVYCLILMPGSRRFAATSADNTRTATARPDAQTAGTPLMSAAAARAPMALATSSLARQREHSGILLPALRARAAAAGMLSPFAATLTATKTFMPAGNPNPGDTITYSIVISNTGNADATAVTLNDTIDPNTTLVPGSVIASPIAVNDPYSTIGNVPFSTNAAQGVIANDLNPNGSGTLTVTQVNATAVPGGGNATITLASGSTVLMNSDGSFTYTPFQGFRGPTETFTYTLGNGTGKTDTATVTFTINGMVWFINNSPGAPGSAPGDGRLTNPFRQFGGASSFDSIATDAANDIIFIYTGASNYTGGVTLLAGQKLIGQGAGDTLLNIGGFSAPSGTVVAPGLPTTGGTNPTIQSAATNITLGSGNTVRGVTLSGTANAALNLSGSNFGTLTLAETTISGSGRAMSLATGTLSGPVASTAAFTSISSTSSTGGAVVSLTGVAGAMSSGSTTITSAGGIGISVDTSSAAISFNTTTAVTNSGGAAVSLTTDTGAITFGTLNITNTTSNQPGLVATNDTQTITVTTGAINTGSGSAININGPGGKTPLNITFVSVSSSGGTGTGIQIQNTTGSFTVVGDGANTAKGGNATGGTISNKDDGGTDGTGTVGSGVFLNNVTNIALRRMTINGTNQNFGILGSNVTTFTLQYCTVSGTNGDNDTQNEDSIRFSNLLGSATIDNCIVDGGFEDNISVINTGGTLNRLTVSNSTIGLNSTLKGDNGLYFEANSGGATAKLTVDSCTFTGSRGDAIDVIAQGGCTTGAIITNNNITNTHTNSLGGGVIVHGNGTSTFNISGNTISGAKATQIVVAKGATSGTHNGTVANNTLGTTSNTKTGGNRGINVDGGGAGSMTVAITGNLIRDYNDVGIGLAANNQTVSGNNANFNATVTGNTVSNPFTGAGTQVLAGIFVDISTGLNNDTSSACIDIGGAGALANDFSTSDPNNVQDIDLSTNDNATFRLPGYGGALKDTAAITAYLKGRNLNSAATTVSVSFGAGASSGYSGGAACTQPSLGGLSVEPGGDFATLSRTDGTALDQADQAILRATHGEGRHDENLRELTQAELNWMVQAAIDRWRQAGLSAEDLARLQAVTFDLADLPNGQIASADSTHIKIDSLGAGYGWYFDPTPAEDSEFDVPVPGRELHTTTLSPAHGKMDLLTVLVRELGTVYLQGKEKTPKKLRPLMEPTLSPDVRRMPVFNVPERSTSSLILNDGQSLNGRVVTPVRPETDFVGLPSFLRPAVFNPDAEWQSGSGDANVNSAGYAARARRVAYNAAPYTGETVNKPLGTIPPGKSVTVMFQATISALNALPVGTSQVCNQGTVTANGGISVQTDDPGKPGATDSTCATLNVADLAVTKTDTPDPVIAGNNITYTITVQNNGPVAALNASFSDALPANTTFVSVTTPAGWTRTDSTAVGATGTITFTNPSFANAATSIFTLVVKVADTTAHNTVITNSASVTSTTGDTTPANNTGTATTTVTGKADLAVTKTDTPDPVFSGNQITYTVNFVNNGPGTAVNVSVTDAVPANTTFASASVTTGTGWTTTNPAVGGTGNVVFSKASVPNGETAVFSIVVNVPSSVAGGTTITNTATATADTSDPTPANNSGTATTNVVAQADLAVTKSDSPDPVLAGNNITYTINFSNNGPGTAQTVTVTDAVPANTTFVSAGVTTGTGWSTANPAVGGTGNVVFSKASVPNGETAVFSIVVKVNPSTGQNTSINNSVTAASTTSDPTPGNNTATATTNVQTQADLQVTKSDAPDPVVSGNNITYTINYTNAGPSDAQGVTVTDAVPANTTFVSAAVTTGSGWTTTNPAVGGTGNVVFSKTTSAAGETATFTILVHVGSNVAGGVSISNSVTAASTTSDPTPGNDTATTTTTTQAAADLMVTKIDTPDPVTAGNNITYTVSFQNNGPSDAQSVTLMDAVPANTTFVSTTTPGGWVRTDSTAVGGTGTLAFTNAGVPAGGTATFTVVVKVNSGTATGTTITNSATAGSTTPDPTPANNTGTATTTVQVSADLAITKTASPTPNVFAGNNITYTINLTNSGPSDAQTVTVTDAVPANTTFVSASVTAGTGWTTTNPAVGGTGNVVFSKATVTGGETATFQIIVKVDAATATGTTITNTATAATTTTESDNTNNTATVTSTVQAQADLTLDKVASPTPDVIAGNQITYTLTLSNAGPGAAASVTVTDAVPANTTFVSAAVTTGSGWSTANPAVGGTGNVVFSKASVANGETAVFSIVVKVNSNTGQNSTITNTATAASTTGDPNPGDNTDATMTNVITRADLAVTKTDSPDPVIAGSNITYTINFSNAGPSDAQSVTVTDAVPANTSLVSAVVTTGSGWSTNTSGPIVFSKLAVAAGESAVFTVVVKVNSNTANGATITNTATAATNTTDTTPGNDSSTATTTVITRADLVVTKSDSPDPVTAGNNLTYTINFSNAGPSDAQTVTVTDAVPANTTFVSAAVTTGSGWSTANPAVGGTGNVVFSKATVVGGESAVFTIVVKVSASTANGVTISNSATAATTTTDPTPGNNTGSATTTVQTQADLAVTKTDTPDPAFAGSNITYTINFSNAGPSDAQTVTVTDAVPANTTFVSAVVTTGSGWGTANPAVGGTGNVVFSKATVAASETAVFTIVVKVNANTTTGTVISNSAVAATTTTDPTPGNNTGSATTTIQTQADLAVTKSDSPDPVIAGNNITYTINLSNNGPSDALGVTVTDAVPANTTFVSAAVTTGSGWGTANPAVGGTGNVVFSKASVVNGETAVFTVVVKVNANTANGATISNSAVAAATTADGNSANNTGSATTSVITRADLAVTKSDSPDPVTAGNNLTYTINFSNAGPSDAQSVTVTDAVPANTTFVSAVVTTGSGWSTNTSGPIVFSKATVAAGESAVFTMVVKVNANTANGATITNSATAATTTTDPTSGNNTGTATTTVQTQADQAVTISDAPDPVIAGNNITYTVNYVNNGPSDAQTVTVTDAVPANTTFVSAVVTTGSGWSVSAPPVGGSVPIKGGGGKVTASNIVFSKATVAASETAVFTIVVKVNSSAANGSTITDTVTAATATTDPTPGNNTATATTTVQTQADLALTKTDSPDPVVASQNLTYTITLNNNGPSDAQTVSVSDTVPANTTFVSATVTTGSGWSTSAPAVGGTGTVTFTKATVAASETAVFTIVVNVNVNTPNNTTLTNTAMATTATTDPTPGNNTATATTTVIAQADLAVTKSDSPDPVCVNGNITYTINFVDNGPGPGLSTTVTDAVPANTTFVSAVVTTGSGWSISAPAAGGTGNVVFSKANVANGETAVFTVVVKVNAGTLHGTVISNTATAASSIPDPTPGNNSATATTTVDPIAPTITCPANITAMAALTCPTSTTAVVNFTPTVSDNCSATYVCSPASGSAFPVGSTTVSCTATDTAGNTASCSFTVTVWTGCVQDDSNPGNVCLYNAQTGKYQFCCNGQVVATGTGTVQVQGCHITINHTKADRRIQIDTDIATSVGHATIQIINQLTCTITDRNLTNNGCMCPVPTP